jgi:hypothetical protein
LQLFDDFAKVKKDFAKVVIENLFDIDGYCDCPNVIKKSIQLVSSPDRADILWALGRLLHCPQIKARAGHEQSELAKQLH